MTQPTANDLARALSSFFSGLRGGLVPEETDSEVLSRARDYRSIGYEPEIRSAKLYSEFEIGGTKYSFDARGARSCKVNSAEFRDERGTIQYNLVCDLSYFSVDHPELGKITIFQDPRVINRGYILLRRNESEPTRRDRSIFELPALSYFNQHLIFKMGERYFYYPRAWQVTASITRWPPEYHQYHHLENRTPVFDLITQSPNAAIKGISTISIEGELTSNEENLIRKAHQTAVDEFLDLDETKLMAPEELTPAEYSGADD